MPLFVETQTSAIVQVRRGRPDPSACLFSDGVTSIEVGQRSLSPVSGRKTLYEG